MEFVCKIGMPTGEVVERTVSAADEGALRSELEGQGLYLLGVRKGMAFGSFELTRKRVKTDTLLIFSQQIAALLKAGLPLYQALDVILERQKNPVFRRSLAAIRDRVRSGASLSDAFVAEGDLYPPVFSASLVAGERSGSLETVLRRYVQYTRVTQSLRKKAVSAAVYPLAVVTLMVVLGSYLVLRVLPKFQEFYTGLNIELPAFSRTILGVAAFLGARIFWVLAVLVVVLAAVWYWLRQPGSVAAVDKALLRTPFLGRMMQIYASSQLSRTLATLLSGGLPLVTGLEVAAGAVGNRAISAAVSAATPQVREGKSLTQALDSTGMFENMTLEMVKVGEQTGALSDMLVAVADFYDEELDTMIARVLALVEPVVLVLLAVGVGSIILSVYLPMFQAISNLQGSVGH
jgi:type IV pilus assembly protein PilC